MTVRGTGTADLLAYDPGGTTGWCVMSMKPRDLLGVRELHKAACHFAAGQIVGSEDEQIDQLVELVDHWPEAAVVGEAFWQRIVNPNLETHEAYSPVRINAVMRWWLATEDRFLFKQNPDLAKRTYTDVRLRECKWWLAGEEHARDATRHAGTFFTRCRKKPKLRHTAWPVLFDEKGEML